MILHACMNLHMSMQQKCDPSQGNPLPKKKKNSRFIYMSVSLSGPTIFPVSAHLSCGRPMSSKLVHVSSLTGVLLFTLGCSRSFSHSLFSVLISPSSHFHWLIPSLHCLLVDAAFSLLVTN